MPSVSWRGVKHCHKTLEQWRHALWSDGLLVQDQAILFRLLEFPQTLQNLGLWQGHVVRRPHTFGQIVYLSGLTPWPWNSHWGSEWLFNQKPVSQNTQDPDNPAFCFLAIFPLCLAQWWVYFPQHWLLNPMTWIKSKFISHIHSQTQWLTPTIKNI